MMAPQLQQRLKLDRRARAREARATAKQRRRVEYQYVVKSAKTWTQRERVYVCLLASARSTNNLIAAKLGEDPNEVIARLHELEDEGRVIRAGRMVGARGRENIAWRAIAPRARAVTLEGFF